LKKLSSQAALVIVILVAGLLIWLIGSKEDGKDIKHSFFQFGEVCGFEDASLNMDDLRNMQIDPPTALGILMTRVDAKANPIPESERLVKILRNSSEERFEELMRSFVAGYEKGVKRFRATKPGSP
jgi:hypothetical protein